MPENPEQRARRKIDAELTAAGWLVQDRDDLDLTAASGIAVREFPMRPGFGFADYLLYLNRKAVGAVATTNRSDSKVNGRPRPARVPKPSPVQ